MIDIGLSKIALVAVVALVVIGPERLPRVARTAGNLFGRAQRYMSDVRNEVSRQMEQEDLKKMKEAAQSAFKSVKEGMDDVSQQIDSTMKETASSLNSDSATSDSSSDLEPYKHPYRSSVRQGRSSWGNKKGAVPLWFKHSTGIKTRAQSGAARVKRFRRAAAQQRAPKSFFG